jgi:hypothetical protein
VGLFPKDSPTQSHVTETPPTGTEPNNHDCRIHGEHEDFWQTPGRKSGLRDLPPEGAMSTDPSNQSSDPEPWFIAFGPIGLKPHLAKLGFFRGRENRGAQGLLPVRLAALVSTSGELPSSLPGCKHKAVCALLPFFQRR